MAVLIVVASVVVGGVQVAGGGDGPATRVLGAAVLLLATGSLYWRYQWPAAVLATTATACVTYYLLDCPPGPEPVPFVVALYAAAAAGRRWTAAAAVPLAVAAVQAADLAAGRPVEGEDLVTVTAVLVAAAGLGELSRSWAEQRDARAHRAAAEERLRIARDLHDTLAHRLTAISVQAGAALRKRDSRPELAYPALETVREVAGEALTEVRSVLGVIRAEPVRDTASSTAGPAGLAGPTGLAGLAGLAELAERAGLDATVTVSGRAAPLPFDVDAALYRIAQEALTNVRRHSGGTGAEVRLAFRRRRVEIEVLDRGDARPDSDSDGGHGIAGMRERTGVLNGRFAAGPRPGGGFRVWASLPR